ncbi:MAG: HAMP domain-containing sensor histidine kinase [Candidatus Margulisiibacteriota bacterium]
MVLPEEEEKVLIHDFRQKYSWGIYVRYAVIALGIPLLLYGFFINLDLRNWLYLFSFLVVYNLAAHLARAAAREVKLWQIIGLISIFEFCDLLAVTFLIYLTAWLESPYWFLYLVLIIISGFGVFSRYSSVVFLIAFFSALFYLGLMVASYTGFIPVYGLTFTLTQQELLRSILNRAIFTIAAFFLFAGTIYYFSQLLNQNQARLAVKNRDLLSALDRMKEVDRAKDEFVSTASHELRTPLAVVRENASLIIDGLVGAVGARQKELLITSLENVDRLAKLLDSLLDISKIKANTVELKRRSTDIAELAARAVSTLRGLAAKRETNIEVRATRGVETYVDPDQVLRVFLNLIDNAIKYDGKKGKILVVVEPQADQIMVTVADNGPGIAPADLPLLFERFVRLEGAAQGGTRGSGLGLSICRAIIEMHGGRIWAESQPGEGTKFIFTLPRINGHG